MGSDHSLDLSGASSPQRPREVSRQKRPCERPGTGYRPARRLAGSVSGRTVRRRDASDGPCLRLAASLRSARLPNLAAPRTLITWKAWRRMTKAGQSRAGGEWPDFAAVIEALS